MNIHGTLKHSLTYYKNPAFDGLETSPEILAAIEALTNSDLLVEDSDARNEWESGRFKKQVLDWINREFLSSFNDGAELFWGSAGVFARMNSGKMELAQQKP